MIPYLDVSHLPSSTSFYSAVLQPLGLYYILQAPCPADEHSSPLRTVTFGERAPSPTPILQLREAATNTAPLKISRIVLAASSSAVVDQVRACAERAKGASISNPFSVTFANATSSPGDHATITDFDGNIMEVMSTRDYSPSLYRDAPVRHTQSTQQEARRILNWNYDVARSEPTESIMDIPASRALGHPTTIRRSVTTSTYEYPIRSDSGGISAGSAAGLAAAGALVGAGIGALVTLSSMKSDRARAPMQEFEAPSVQRRSTYPERLPSERGSRGDRYIEVERTTVQKIRYPEDYLPATSSPLRAPPSRYSQAGSTAKSRAVDDTYERDGRSTRYEASRAGTSRTRSEAPTQRMPLLLTEAEHRSQVSSRPSHRSQSRHASSHHSSVVDMEPPVTYARSHRSDARSSVTVRPASAAVPHVTELVTRNKPGSRVTETQTVVRLPSASKSHVSRPPNASRSGSIVSARQLPLPRSSVMSSHSSAWEDVDDHGSVAPSDSISCAGSRRRSRSYY